MKVKLNNDWEADDNARWDSPHCYNKLLSWFNTMAQSQQYSDVDKTDFVRKPRKEQKRKRKVDAVVGPDDDADYVFLQGKPPPKRRARWYHQYLCLLAVLILFHLLSMA